MTASADNKQRAPGVPNPPLTITYSGFVNGDTEAVLDSKPTTATAATVESAPGEYPIVLTGGADANYLVTLINGLLTVSEKAAPNVAWNPPAPVTYGQPLSGNQLSATSDVSGSFEYSPNIGTILNAGNSQPLTATFTPSDGIRYTTATTVVQLDVLKAPLTASADNKQRAPGVPNPPLTIAYSGFVNGDTEAVLDSKPIALTAATVESAPGDYPIVLSGGAGANYLITLINGVLTVLEKAVPNVAWNPPAPITYGQPLSGNQLSATSDVSGSFEYSPNIGTILNAGNNQPLTVTFTPSDEIRYSKATAVVHLNVLKAPLVVSADNLIRGAGFSNPALTASYSGFVNGDTPERLGSPPVLSTEAETTSEPGEYPILVTGASSPDYQITFVQGVLTVSSKRVPAITWLKPASITYGIPLSNIQLNASANVRGSLEYEPDNGILLAPGKNQQLTVRFLPADPTAYAEASATASIDVGKAPLTISALNTERKVGDPNPVFNLEYSGFVNGDNAAALEATPRVTTTATTSSSAGTYQIIPSEAVAQNYEITYVPGVLTIISEPENRKPVAGVRMTHKNGSNDILIFYWQSDAGQQYTVEQSTDLLTWTQLKTITATDTNTEVDIPFPSFSSGLYVRAVKSE